LSGTLTLILLWFYSHLMTLGIQPRLTSLELLSPAPRAAVA